MNGVTVGIISGSALLLALHISIYLPGISSNLKDIADNISKMAKHYGFDLDEETVAKLEEMSEKKFTDNPADPESYKQGLVDGSTLTAQYVLGTLADGEDNA